MTRKGKSNVIFKVSKSASISLSGHPEFSLTKISLQSIKKKNYRKFYANKSVVKINACSGHGKGQ